jgi:hypothetical protein
LAALEAALRPGELELSAHERSIARALEDPLAPPTHEELASAELLRRALDGEDAHEDAALLEALRPSDLATAQAATARAVERALAANADEGTRPAAGTPRGPGRVIFVVFGAAGALAAAAAVLLLVTSVPAPPSSLGQDAYARPRSTAPLFDEPFDTSATTARIDRIASSRGRELRDNRYAAWGAR